MGKNSDDYLKELFSAASSDKAKTKRSKRKEKSDTAGKAFESYLFGENGLKLESLGIETPKEICAEQDIVEQQPIEVVDEQPEPVIAEETEPKRKLPKIPKLGEPGAFLRESPEYDRDSSKTIEGSLHFLDKVTASNNDHKPDPKVVKEETELSNIKAELARMKGAILEISRAAAAQGGGGEVNLLRLDDVSGDNWDTGSDGQLLLWSSADQKFVSSSERGVDDFFSEGIGGYEFTGGFSDREAGQTGASDFGTFVAYTQAMADAAQWRRFGFSEEAQQANDVAYFPTDARPNRTFDQTKGLFGGIFMPSGVTELIDYGWSGPSYSNEVNSGIASDFNYTAADGSFDFRECQPGDLLQIRFDFNVNVQIANTTLEIALIWQTRDADDNPTFTFALTGQPIFYGTGTVGRTFLNRPIPVRLLRVC